MKVRALSFSVGLIKRKIASVNQLPVQQLTYFYILGL